MFNISILHIVFLEDITCIQIFSICMLYIRKDIMDSICIYKIQIICVIHNIHITYDMHILHDTYYTYPYYISQPTINYIWLVKK